MTARDEGIAGGWPATRNMKIKKLATEHYLRSQHYSRLARQMRGSTDLDVIFYSRQFPYKFGVMRILADIENTRSGLYHSDPLTSLGFEFLKFLHDVHDRIGLEGRSYLQAKVNNYVTADRQDFAPLITEIDIFLSLRPLAPEIEMGERNGRADIRISNEAGDWDIECKSIRHGHLKDLEMRGLCKIFKSILVRPEVMKDGREFTSWTINDQKLLTSDPYVLGAINDVLKYYRARKINKYELGNNELVSLHAMRQGGTDLAGFIQSLSLSSVLQRAGETHTYTLLADQLQDPPLWATVFYTYLKIAGLIEACQDVFNEAMDQHALRATKSKVVLINIECLHVLNVNTGISTVFEAMSEAVKRRSNLYSRAIFDGLKRKSRWHSCTGVILVFALPPKFTQEDGTNWERMITWGSPTGNNVVKEFPALAALMRTN